MHLITKIKRLKLNQYGSLCTFSSSIDWSNFRFPEIEIQESTPSMDWKALHQQQHPIIIRGLVEQWPAVSDSNTAWRDLAKLKSRISDSVIVPVEVGNTYMDPNIRKAEVDLCSFLDYIQIEKHSSKSTDSFPRVYWAQHELSEVPEMHKDVAVPDMCLTTGKGTLYRTNIWFGGTEGSVSPCHFDPYDNLLCQVLGSKEVTVFSPEFGNTYLYPAVGTVQANTAMVDISNPDFDVHPLYREGLRVISEQNTQNEDKKQQGARGVLRPGDALYIPFKWWHYCEFLIYCKFLNTELFAKLQIII